MKRRCLALSGGVGGAKLTQGLAACLAADELLVVVNTADDFEHLGLLICPDLDTMLYTLSGRANPELGWGVRDETWRCMEAMADLGGETWFSLGDSDLATHLRRKVLLEQGNTLSEVTSGLFASLGVEHKVLPMSDQPVRTIVHTETGDLPFQNYFVRDRCAPKVTGFTFEGIELAEPAPVLSEWLSLSEMAAVVICPSNPFVSVGPILAVPGFLDSIQNIGPVVAVSPIIGGQAIKGPAAKMMAELKMPVTSLAVAEHYGQILDGFVIDQQDAHLAPEIEALGMRTLVTSTIMHDKQSRQRLAQEVLEFTDELAVQK